MLAACVIGALLCGIVLYNYLPSRKEVPEVATYEPTKSVSQALADDIDTKNEDVILTFEQGQYEVTSRDLNNYENKNIYVPGKSNPFAAISSDINGSSSTGTSSGKNSGKTSSSNNTSKDKKTKEEYIKDKGTK